METQYVFKILLVGILFTSSLSYAGLSGSSLGRRPSYYQYRLPPFKAMINSELE